jgi:prepilin-type processing-associated H-X9-DG protein/prepilin-type N-terminal cleavage/methylation domain-containing protein
MHRHRAFTLVELLVVLFIIALLLALLLPTLSRAREQANAIKCASNLSQLAKNWHSYAAENRNLALPGRLPKFNAFNTPYLLGNGLQYRPHWYEMLGAQMKIYADRNPSPMQRDGWKVDNDLYTCPSVDWRNSRNFVWGYNYQFLGNTHDRLSAPVPVHYPVNMSALPKASETVMAADCMGTAAGHPAAMRQGHYDEGQHVSFALGNKGHLLDPPRLTDDSDFADPEARTADNRSAPDPRHLGRANVAFLDGHIERLTLQELGYVVRPDGSVAPNGGLAHNRKFSGTGEDRDPPSIR